MIGYPYDECFELLQICARDAPGMFSLGDFKCVRCQQMLRAVYSLCWFREARDE